MCPVTIKRFKTHKFQLDSRLFLIIRTILIFGLVNKTILIQSYGFFSNPISLFSKDLPVNGLLSGG